MATVVQLIYKNDFSDPVVALTLTAYTNGFAIPRGGWIPVESNGDDPITETLLLDVKGSNSDDLAAKLAALDAVIEYSQTLSPVDTVFVYLRVQVNGETYGREAPVLRLERTGAVPLLDQPAAGGALQGLKLKVVRRNWESVIAYYATSFYGTPSTPSYADGTGTLFDTGVTVGGNYPARVLYARVTAAPTGGGIFTKTWVGFRTNRYGNRLNFVPVWNARKGTALWADTTVGTTNPDATATDGYKVVCTFASSTALIPRVRIRVNQITANVDDQRGRFHVLMRAAVSAAGTKAKVRVGYAVSVSAEFTEMQPQEVSDTSWEFYEMGRLQLPVGGNLISAIDNVLNALQVSAERTAGAGFLWIDTLVLIPYDEGFVYIEGGAAQYSGSTYSYNYLMQSPQGEIKGYGTDLTGNSAMYDVTGDISGGVPVGPVAVVSATSRKVSVKGELYLLYIAYRTRWRHLRGAVGT